MDKTLNGDPYLAKIKDIVMGKINKDSKFDYVRVFFSKLVIFHR